MTMDLKGPIISLPLIRETLVSTGFLQLVKRTDSKSFQQTQREQCVGPPCPSENLIPLSIFYLMSVEKRMNVN